LPIRHHSAKLFTFIYKCVNINNYYLTFRFTFMQSLINWIGLKRVLVQIRKHPYITVLIVASLAAGSFLFLKEDPAQEEARASERVVTLADVSDLAEGAAGVAYPTADRDTYVVRAEASGRITRTISTGTKVDTGAIIATIENASERAALTQAQGAYEAARAGAAQSDIGVTDARAALTAAKQDAIADHRSALAVSLNVLYNTVDELFNNPRISPGVRIDASGRAPALNQSRLDLQSQVTAWENDVSLINEGSDVIQITAVLDRASTRISELSSMVNTFITLLSKQKPDGLFSESELARLASEFASAQASLNTQAAALDSAKTALRRSEESVASASIGGTGGEISSANAAVKQALGTYQAAQANYNRTLVKAPFAGIITAQNVVVGDIISVGADIAMIKPDAGVETMRWWHLPLSAVKYTPDSAFVFIVNDQGLIEALEVETGLVTANDLRVTGLKGDEMIVTDVRGLKTGDKVEVAI
jgi:multidrug resistance efflux pump